MKGGAPHGLRGVTIFGIAVGVAGALLDFYSGFQILVQSSTAMGMYTPSGLALGLGVSALGMAVLATAFTAVSTYGMRNMNALGFLMATFGVLMLFIGGSMYWGLVPLMQAAMISGLGMIVVGMLMVISGSAMWRSRVHM